MGNNGGFNPFRDANGEFTTPDGSGKPGRSRARTGGTSGASGRPNAVAGATKFRGAPPPDVAPPNPGRGYRTSTGAVVPVARDLAGHVREASRLQKQSGKQTSTSGRSAASKAALGGTFLKTPQQNADGSATVFRQDAYEVRVTKGVARTHRDGVAEGGVTRATGPGIAAQVNNVKDNVRNAILTAQGRAPHSRTTKQ